MRRPVNNASRQLAPAAAASLNRALSKHTRRQTRNLASRDLATAYKACPGQNRQQQCQLVSQRQIFASDSKGTPIERRARPCKTNSERNWPRASAIVTQQLPLNQVPLPIVMSGDILAPPPPPPPLILDTPEIGSLVSSQE